MLDALRFDISAMDVTARAFASVKAQLGDVRGALAGISDQAMRTGRSMRNIGAGMSAAVTAPLSILGKQSVDLYDQQVRAQTAVETAIKSTGGAAGLSAEELFRMASGLQAMTTFGDEGILQDVTAPLLTFTKVAGPEFERAQGLVLDMSTLLKTDLKSAAMQVGKALNDPVKGVSSLAEAGVQFSADQQKMIKALVETGDVARAQGIILSELENQFGGQAAAAAGAPLGQWRQLQNAIGDVKEQLGEQVVPFLKPLVESVKEAVAWFADLDSEVKKTIVVIGGLAAAIGPVLGVMGLAVMGVTTLAGAFATLGTVLLANPIGLAIAAIAAGAAWIWYNWEPISEWFSSLWSTIRDRAIAGWDLIKGVFLNYTPAGLIYSNWDAIAGWFGEKWAAVQAGVSIAWDLISGLFTGKYSAMQIFSAGWSNLRAVFDPLMEQVKQSFVAGWESVKALAAQWVADFLAIGGEIVDGLKAGIQAKWDGLVGWFSERGNALKQSFKDTFGIRSPSRVFREYGGAITEGLSIGITDGLPMVDTAMQGLSAAVGKNGLAAAAQQTESAFKSMFQSIVSGSAKPKDALRTLGQSLLGNAASKLFDNAWAGIWGGLKSILPFADGGVIGGGRVQAFASGGIVTSPTTFPMQGGSGLMGEAGPEAIMPLARIGGKLGVRSEGGGGNSGGQMDVRVYVDQTGNWQAAVERISGNVVSRAAPAIVRQSVQATHSSFREVRPE